MADGSAIEWTDATWNPVSGCTKVSPGCDNCYAERIFERFHGKGSFQSVSLHPERLDTPLRWRKPRRVFVNSMSDLFHVAVHRDYIGQVWQTMQAAPQHQFQILTKRAERMERVVTHVKENVIGEVPGMDVFSPLPNVWLGVSVETPEYYSRIRHLQRTPAALHFLSCEPLLSALPDLPLDGIDWVIVGGESGPGSRPMHPKWVMDIRDQCQRAGVAFFFKQWGAWGPIGPVYVDLDADPDLYDRIQDAVLVAENSQREVRWLSTDGFSMSSYEAMQPFGGDPWWIERRTKKKNGRSLDGRTWDGMPAVAAEIANVR